MRASVRPCLGHGIVLDMWGSVRPCPEHGIGIYMEASVRPCLGHGIGLDFATKLAWESRDVEGIDHTITSSFGIVGVSRDDKKAW
ncbi:Uncharacterized protein F383_21289 [Gossypium arboreum]|uniref:Uncharacterized protein n=1 Tax=Gossypium arboreum TaxID=29729 RepID=A0A0B0NM16_GOSAR|nr:Uncharacterized protein F383_21289 [Gossypium arboreum]